MPKPPGTWAVQSATLRRQPGHGCGSGVYNLLSRISMSFILEPDLNKLSPGKSISIHKIGRNFAEKELYLSHVCEEFIS